VKSDVVNLSETRVKFDVEISFSELEDEIAAAYQKIGGQVQIPGFRKGRVPRQIIDQRVGRGPVLEEVVNSRVPKIYDELVSEAGIFALGQPDLDITEISDGDKITFTAEVDIRPEFDLPDYQGIDVEVDALDVSDEDVDEQLDTLRARFGSYKPVERAAEEGDVLLIDLKAVADGQEVEDLSQQALSYDVGEDGVVPGLDAVVIGLSEGEEATFTFTPEFGDQEGVGIEITVAVNAVRERVLPEVDDELAMMASEFDTVEELLGDIRDRLGRNRMMERGQQARNKLNDELLEMIDIPVPDGVVEAELAEHFGDGHGDDEHREETERNARRSLKGQFIFDKIADAEEVSVGEAELSQWLMMQAPQYGMEPQQFAQALVEAGQVPTAVAEIRRGKALGIVLESANVVDTNGESVDLKEIDRVLREGAGLGDDDESDDGRIDDGEGGVVDADVDVVDAEAPEDSAGPIGDESGQSADSGDDAATSVEPVATEPVEDNEAEPKSDQ
jgi:trigger factor